MIRKGDTTPTMERRSAGTIAGRRQPLTWPSGRPFRILSIDGGGIKGLFPASILAAFERSLCGGRSAGDYFDLIAGTSTGGIIALGLALGLPAAAIRDLYLEHGRAIFPPIEGPFTDARRWWRGKSQIWRYTYEREPLERALEGVLGGHLLGDAQRRLCIPSFEGAYGEVHVFKTPHHPDFRKDWQERMIDVALATAAAPTFFKTYKSGGRVFADGGVWANNPVMIGLVDALTAQGVDRDDIEILSISCGDVDVPFTEGQANAGGLFHWRTIIKSAMHLASQNATGQAGLLIGRDSLLRVDPPAEIARLEMDDFGGAVRLIPAKAEAMAADLLPRLERIFGTPAEVAPAFYGPRASGG